MARSSARTPTRRSSGSVPRPRGMHQLIDDLLDSSISREQQLRIDVVDLESVARSVAEQLTVIARLPVPQIEVGRLPDVYADAGLVRQLLDNLVGNAVKYVIPGTIPRVSVTGRRSATGWR